MLLITLAAVLIFYVMGMTINQIGIRNVRSDMQDALEAHTRYVADQLDREMDRLKFFIQRIRFEPRIRVKIEELPEEIAGKMIPSLIIQPIVENAFQHGVKDLEKDGLVSLRYEVKETEFSVIVSDNSGKMDDEKVQQLWEHVTDPASPDSSALCNLYRRLKLYGDTGNELELKCVDGGLTAVLTFPKGETKHHADTDDRG